MNPSESLASVMRGKVVLRPGRAHDVKMADSERFTQDDGCVALVDCAEPKAL